MQRESVLLLHVLIDCSLRASVEPAQQCANPPVIITPQPSLRGTKLGSCSIISVCRSQQPPRNTLRDMSLLYSKNPGGSNHLTPFQNHSPWGIGCSSLCQLDLFWFLEKRKWNITQPAKVVKCIYAWQAEDHQVQLFFFHQSDIDNRELHLESRPQPLCQSYHLFALLTILKSDLCTGINTAELSPNHRLRKETVREWFPTWIQPR